MGAGFIDYVVMEVGNVEETAMLDSILHDFPLAKVNNPTDKKIKYMFIQFNSKRGDAGKRNYETDETSRQLQYMIWKSSTQHMKPKDLGQCQCGRRLTSGMMLCLRCGR